MRSVVSMTNTVNIMFLRDVSLMQSEARGSRFLRNIVCYQTPPVPVAARSKA